MTSIRCTRLNHMNVALRDFDATVEQWGKMYGAEFLADHPIPEWRAGLIEMGQVLFEMFVPHQYLLNSRYGPHYVGLEFQADMDQVREAVASQGLRLVRDIGVALHTDPRDGFGVAFEFFGDYFHDRHWDRLGRKMLSVEYWRDEHPLGLRGLKRYSIAVNDIDRPSKFLQSFLSAEPVYEAARPQVEARAQGLRISDSVAELITPTGSGALQQHLHRFGEGIRSTVFAVRNIDQARRYFAERAIAVVPGDAPGAFAIPPEANLGVLFEFSE